MIESMRTTVWNSVWGALLMLCVLACSDASDEEWGMGDEAREGLELVVAMHGDFELNTRTQLVTSEPMHHIEHMYAYLFASSGNGWTDKDVCIYNEKLPWQPNEWQQSSFRCRLKTAVYDEIEKKAPDAKELMLLVVGVDNHPETYHFPDEGGTPTKDMHLGMEGKKLSEVKMSLAKAVDPSLMSFTEVFAGFKRFYRGASSIQVNLSRRVAGVLCYLNDIPARINDYHIIGVQLHCLGGVNTQGSLKPVLNDDPTAEHYKPTFVEWKDKKNEKATLLAEVNLKELGAQADKDGSLLYIPPVQEPDGLQTLPNTVLMGAYMLPVQQGAQFNIRLVGEKRDADGKPTEDKQYVFTSKDTDGYYLVKNSKGEATYPLQADYIYQMGVKPYLTDTDYDDPLSLKGKPLKVEANRWEEVKVDVDFPNTQLGIILNTGNSSAFRYDCINDTTTVKVQVMTPQFKDKKWIITSSVNWLRLINDKGNKVELLTGTGEKDIQMVLEDYIDGTSKNRKEPDKDYRWTDLTLQVVGNPIQSTTRIRQWNALIVTTWDEDHKKSWDIAFSRLDNGMSINPDGTPNVDEKKIETYEWAYGGYYPVAIFDGGAGNNSGDDGLANYNSMKTEVSQDNSKKEEWDKSVVNLAHRNGWYVPARIELHALLHDMGHVKSAHLGEPKVRRWTSTAVGGSNRRSYASDLRIQKVDKWWNEKDDYTWDRERNNNDRFRVRLAHKIEQPKEQN